MLEALRTETARIQLSIAELDTSAPGGAGGIRRVGSKYVAPANEFILLRATVTNLSRECRTTDLLGNSPT